MRFRPRQRPQPSAPPVQEAAEPPRAPARGRGLQLPASPAAHESALGSATAVVASWCLRLLVIAAAVVGVLFVLREVWVVLMPVLLGLLLTTVLWPATRLLRRWLPPAAASGIVLVAGLAALGGLVTLLTTLIANEAQSLADAVVSGLEDVQEWTTGPPLSLGDDGLGQVIDDGLQRLQDNAQSVAGYALTGVTTAGSLLVTTVLALVLCFFFLKDGPRFLPWASQWVGPRAAPHVREVCTRAWETLSGFIRAQAMVGLVDGVGIGLGLLVLGVPLAFPLAVLTVIGAFVPIIGAFVAGALAVLVALVTNGPTTALMVLILVLVVQQLEGNVVSPMLMGRTLRLHPALVILAVTVGGSLWGIAGAFLAVPIFAVATTVLRYAREEYVKQPRPHPPGQPVHET